MVLVPVKLSHCFYLKALNSLNSAQICIQNPFKSVKFNYIMPIDKVMISQSNALHSAINFFNNLDRKFQTELQRESQIETIPLSINDRNTYTLSQPSITLKERPHGVD